MLAGLIFPSMWYHWSGRELSRICRTLLPTYVWKQLTSLYGTLLARFHIGKFFSEHWGYLDRDNCWCELTPGCWHWFDWDNSTLIHKKRTCTRLESLTRHNLESMESEKLWISTFEGLPKLGGFTHFWIFTFSKRKQCWLRCWLVNSDVQFFQRE